MSVPAVILGRRVAVGAAIFIALAAVPADAQIASHRAAYTLSLDKSKSASGISEIRGAMLIEWQEVCEGWTLAQRMRFAAYDGDGNALDSDISFTSWEARDGANYRFATRTARNGEEIEQIRGRARLQGRGEAGEAIFSEPERQNMDLPAGTIFPTEHSIALIDAARKGERVFARKVFDGATLDGTLEINAVIAGQQPAETIKKDGVDSELLKHPWWRVRMAFFKLTDPAPSPEYETSMKMLGNGVGTEFIFEYEDFSIRAVLDRLEPLPPPRC